MKIKTKLALHAVRGWFILHRSRTIGKKILKEDDEVRYPMQWRNDYTLKKNKKLAKWLGIELEVIGWENLPKAPALLTPNHSSSFDVPLIMMALENPSEVSTDLNHKSVYLSKEELRNNKKFKGFSAIMNTYYIDRKNPRKALKVIDDFSAHAKKYKKYAVVFPEGTRSKDGKLGEFKSGAFRMAKKDYMPIVPVTINNAIGITNFDRKGKIKVQVVFGKAIKPSKLLTMSTQDIANMVKKQVQKNWTEPTVKRSAKGEKIV